MRLEPFCPEQTPNPVAGDATLDEVLALNAGRTPDAPALPANGLPFAGTWREVDQAVSGLADVFAGWSLGDDAVVGVQLGSSPQGALTCLALWRAGLIPAMLPLAWRRREIAAALVGVGATAIVAHVDAGGGRLAEGACEIAAGLDRIRFVGSFGEGAPDGATPLDEAFAAPAARIVRDPRPEDAADHVAVVTFDAGGVPVPRSHNELIAAALGPLAAARLAEGDAILSTLDLAGLAGFSTGLVPWLLTGAAACFHQAGGTDDLARAAAAIAASHVVLPGRLAARLAQDGALAGLRNPTVTAVWRAPDGRGAAVDIPPAGAIVDAILFGELGLVACARTARERHVAPPLGLSGPDGFSALIDVKISPEGRLLVRGPACPRAPCPADPAAPTLAFDPEGYLDTGIAGVADRASRRVSFGGRRRGVAQIGGLALAMSDAEAAYRSAGAGGRPVQQDDPLFGARLALPAGAQPEAAGALREAGYGPALAPVELVAEVRRLTA